MKSMHPSKHQGISGYMAPIVAQELVRTREVSYPYLLTHVLQKSTKCTNLPWKWTIHVGKYGYEFLLGIKRAAPVPIKRDPLFNRH